MVHTLLEIGEWARKHASNAGCGLNKTWDLLHRHVAVVTDLDAAQCKGGEIGLVVDAVLNASGRDTDIVV